MSHVANMYKLTQIHSNYNFTHWLHIKTIDIWHLCWISMFSAWNKLFETVYRLKIFLLLTKVRPDEERAYLMSHMSHTMHNLPTLNHAIYHALLPVLHVCGYELHVCFKSYYVASYILLTINRPFKVARWQIETPMNVFHNKTDTVYTDRRINSAWSYLQLDLT